MSIKSSSNALTLSVRRVRTPLRTNVNTGLVVREQPTTTTTLQSSAMTKDSGASGPKPLSMSVSKLNLGGSI